MRRRFSGSMTALVTPFRDGKIDAEALERLVEHQIAHGTGALVPCGSTGESATLTNGEHLEVLKLVVGFAADRIPVIAGTGSNSTGGSNQPHQRSQARGSRCRPAHFAILQQTHSGGDLPTLQANRDRDALPVDRLQHSRTGRHRRSTQPRSLAWPSSRTSSA